MTRKSGETLWPHPPSESEEDAETHGRSGVDWMDFDKSDGGPTRKMVHLGIREEESKK